MLFDPGSLKRRPENKHPASNAGCFPRDLVHRRLLTAHGVNGDNGFS
jgi:hypothetical protein